MRFTIIEWDGNIILGEVELELELCFVRDVCV